MLVLGTLSFATLHRALQPDDVIVFNDDFGYLRSVIETLQRLRPWTDDWLEPWSASLSVLCASAFRLTGSFTFATQGMQVLFMAGGFAALGALLCRRNLSTLCAVVLAAVALLFPTVLWKQVEFTALALYLPCLLLAILSAERGRWLGFGFFTVLAVSSRASAVAWLCLPIWALLRVCGDADGRKRRRIMPMAAAISMVALAYLACAAGMNKTHAQTVMTKHMWEALSVAGFSGWFGCGAFIILTAIGVARLVQAGLGSGMEHLPRRSFGAWIATGVMPACAMLSLLWRWRHADLQFEHDLFAVEQGRHLALGLIVAGIAGWLIAPARLNGAYVAAAAACAGLASLRGAVWDYYFIDAAVLAGLAVESPPAGTTRVAVPFIFRWSGRLAAAALLVLVLAKESSLIEHAKRTIDTHHAVVVLCERGLREDKMQVTDLSLAPFGFAGWMLYPYFLENGGSGPVYIAGFTEYLRGGALQLETRAWNDPHALENQDRIVCAGIFRALWRERHQFILRRNEAVAPATLTLNPTRYVRPKFPLSDAEWREFIKN